MAAAASTITFKKNGNTITLSGELTSDFDQMKRECSGSTHSLFGDVSKLIPKLGDKLTEQQVLDLLSKGTEEEFYVAQKVWCYFCVEPGTFRNYMFAPMDSENRDNKYARLRRGVANFSRKARFDVYIISCE
tara:strand:+ start:320 stop:715 length:396 start_codon:yes stop_codon:yes gene_type:complete